MPSGSIGLRLGYNGSYVCFVENYRSIGFNLRCVQEFARKLFRESFFPSVGYLNYPSGELRTVGSSGFWWSSSVLAYDGGYLSVTSSQICLQFYARANGIPVRCVQAFTGSVSGFFFPSAGCRHSVSGALEYIGADGDCWLSSVSGSSAFRMFYDGASLYLGALTRTRGYSLRCVQALAWNLFRDGFFPSAGYRHRDTGEVSGVGPVGGFWSISVLEYDAGYLSTTSVQLCLQFYARANGLMVRCVQAFTDSVSGGFLPDCGVPSP